MKNVTLLLCAAAALLALGCQDINVDTQRLLAPAFGSESARFSTSGMFTLVNPNSTGTIQYSLDGSVPSIEYEGSPVALSSTTSVRARVVFPGLAPSAEASKTFTKVWTGGTALLAGRYAACVETVGGYAYVIGGADAAGSSLATVYRIDAIDGTWEARDSLNLARDHAASAVVAGKIYVMGGNVSGSPTDTIESYDPAADAWTTETETLTAGRSGLSACTDGSVIYLAGGWLSGYSMVAESYAPADGSGTVTALPDMTTARTNLSMIFIGGLAYAIGGLATGPAATGVVEAYDPARGTWNADWDPAQTFTTRPVAAWGMAAAVHDGNIYTLGGTKNTTTISTDVYVYSPASNTWLLYQPIMPLGLQRIGLCTFGEEFFLAGGTTTAGSTALNAGATNSVYSYIP